MFDQRISRAFVFFLVFFFCGAVAMPVIAQDNSGQPRPVKTENITDDDAGKKKLVLESYEELGLALQYQERCKLLPYSEGRAMLYYSNQMRQYLFATETGSVMAKMHEQIVKSFSERVKKAAGNLFVLCNKETMVMVEESLTSASVVNGVIGNRPFDVRADTVGEILLMLKASARLKGAARQCPGSMKEASFAAMVQKNALNAIILSAMGTMQGIDRKELGRIKLISAKTATSPEWKSRCRVDIFLAHNKKMEQLIKKIRQ